MKTPAERIEAAAARLRAERTLPGDGTTRIDLAPGEVRDAVAVCDAAGSAALRIEAAEGAVVRLTEVVAAGASRTVQIRQQAGSRVELLVVQLGASAVDCTVDLEGPRAECRVDGLFLAAEGERAELRLRTNHHAADCRSESLVKGVAGAGGQGCFLGRVYVAPGAQRTDARQTSRNIEVGDGARIVAKPELEIYADDVQCSHGATVGQLDRDAIFYMRQRGLDERQAQRLQIEGFAADVVAHGASEALRDVLTEAVAAKLELL